ncbi:MAG TPA: ATP-binding protein, partial [Ktedonobacterales bacterium]|nr:ATP-binding protein [Ktedonobacterales bacterium]
GGTLPADIEDGLLRVTQEALANVARHSQAQHVQITLSNEGDQVTLTLADDGRGFTPGASDTAGVGLSSMRERMQALGGSLTIESAHGQGTRIEAQCLIRS